MCEAIILPDVLYECEIQYIILREGVNCRRLKTMTSEKYSTQKGNMNISQYYTTRYLRSKDITGHIVLLRESKQACYSGVGV
jgi:hypothetical protein